MTQATTPAEKAAEAFQRLHGRAPDGVWSAPGRVNLIGEHTDYNDGYVLPFALPHRIAVAASPRADGVMTVSTMGDDGGLQEADPVVVADLVPGTVKGWAAYPGGVAWALREQGIAVTGGADLVIAGDVPAGAGLSSSHALECAVALALLGLARRRRRAGGHRALGAALRERLRGRADRHPRPDGIVVLHRSARPVLRRALRQA